MLGESHNLFHEFPEKKGMIEKLMVEDADFKNHANEYHTIDTNIRELETNGSPTTDEHMHDLKVRRAHLKDVLYAKLK